jgi:nucleotide-binding universal stress UspA family protein
MARRFLVPLDGSSGSETVLAHIADLARAASATVRLVHVAAPPESRLDLDGRVLAYADQVAAEVAYEVRRYLAARAASLPGVTVETVVRFGEPADEIVAEGERWGADLIAMASHRRQGFRRLVDGSVAERVERRSASPVLLVDHGERPPAEPPGEPREGGRLVRRQFWCALHRREVEVDFVEHGLPGFPRSVSVQSCSAFEPATAITCPRRCTDAAFRRQWEPALPVYARGAM